MEKSTIKKLLAIEKEIESRNRSLLRFYNNGEKVHQKQMDFHKCDKRNRWIFGGNRSGKTECGAVETVWMLRGIHPYRQNKQSVCGWVVSLSSQVQRDVAQKKILDYLPCEWIDEIVMKEGKKDSADYGIIDFLVVKNVFGGKSRLGFRSCDQGREKFQGASLDFVWFDEEPPKDIYDECKMRVLDKSGDIFGTMTPLKGLTFVYDEIFLNSNLDDEVWCEFMEWADNPFLEKSEVERLSKTMSESELESRKYGRFYQNSGLVYSEFSPNIHVVEPFEIPLEWQDNISIDPGLHNPLSCHFYACDFDGNVYVVAEHYEAKLTVAEHSKKIMDIAKRLNWHFDSKGRLNALIDSAAKQRTLASSQSVVDLFFENGILVNPNVDKDLFAGISRVKSFLMQDGKPRLFIFKNCVNLIREIKSYWWGAEDRPKKADDHALDELRYYIMSKPHIPVVAKQKSIISKHKEMLFRQIKRERDR